MTTGQIIADCAKRTVGYADRLIKGVEPHMAARKPTWGIGGQEIDCNHASFVLGHLAIYPQRVISMLGGTPKTQVPPSFTDLFKAGVPCKDDPHGTIYPPFKVIADVFSQGMAEAIDAVSKAKDADFAKPLPDEKMREHFPTIGHACLFLMNNHLMVHLGQMSTWRRAMGLPAA